MRRKLAYLAGPYSGDIEKNLAAAIDIAAQLVELGYSVVCPHANTHYVHLRMIEKGMTPLDPIQWNEFDFEILRRCDILVMMPNWKESTGARLEKVFAEQLGIRVYVWGDKDMSLAFNGIRWDGKQNLRKNTIWQDIVKRGPG